MSIWPIVHLSGTETPASYVAVVGSGVVPMLPSQIMKNVVISFSTHGTRASSVVGDFSSHNGSLGVFKLYNLIFRSHLKYTVINAT